MERLNALVQKKIGQSILGKVKDQIGRFDVKKEDVCGWIEMNVGQKSRINRWTVNSAESSDLHVILFLLLVKYTRVENNFLLLNQVHLAMVRYHEGGRFCEKDEQWDQESAMLHLERAALCGELEAIVAMGQCCLHLPHHILPEMELEVGHSSLFGLLVWCGVHLFLTFVAVVGRITLETR